MDIKLGPFVWIPASEATLLHARDFLWCYIYTDSAGALQSLRVAPFHAQALCAPNESTYTEYLDDIPEKFCLMDPEQGLGAKPFCLGILHDDKQVFRFRFMESTPKIRIMPADRSYNGYWSIQPTDKELFHINENDYLAAVESLNYKPDTSDINLKTLVIDQHLALAQHHHETPTQLLTDPEQYWLQERNTLMINFKAVTCSVTKKQRRVLISWIMNDGFFTQWENLKRESLSLNHYCLILTEILKNRIIKNCEDLHDHAVMDSNAWLLRGYILPTGISKFKRYELPEKISIKAIHAFLMSAIHQELTRYQDKTTHIGLKPVAKQSIHKLPRVFNCIYPGSSLHYNDLFKSLYIDTAFLVERLKSPLLIKFDEIYFLIHILNGIFDELHSVWIIKSDLNMIHSYLGLDPVLDQDLSQFIACLALLSKSTACFNSPQTFTLVETISNLERLTCFLPQLDETEHQLLLSMLATNEHLHAHLPIDRINDVMVLLSEKSQYFTWKLLLKNKTWFQSFQHKYPESEQNFPRLRHEVLPIAKQYWKYFIHSIDDLVFILNYFDNAQVEIMLSELPDNKLASILSNVDALKQLLTFPSFEKIRITLRVLQREESTFLLNSPLEFIELAQCISTKQMIHFINSWPAGFIFQSIADLGMLKNTVPEDIVTCIFHNLQTDDLILYMEDTANKLKVFYPDSKVKNTELNHFDYVLSKLSQIKRLPDIIKDVTDLQYMIDYCILSFFEKILRHITNEHWSIILKTRTDLVFILTQTPPDEANSIDFIDRFLAYIPYKEWKKIIETKQDYIHVINQCPLQYQDLLNKHMPSALIYNLLPINDTFFYFTLQKASPSGKQFILKQLPLLSLKMIFTHLTDASAPFYLLSRSGIYLHLQRMRNTTNNPFIRLWFDELTEHLYECMIQEQRILPRNIPMPMENCVNIRDLSSTLIKRMRQSLSNHLPRFFIPFPEMGIFYLYMKNTGEAGSLIAMKEALIECRAQIDSTHHSSHMTRNALHALLFNACSIQNYEQPELQGYSVFMEPG